MKIASTNIIIEEMKFFAYHGVLPQENVVGATYKVSLNIKTDFTRAALADELDGTINYAEVYETVKREMEINSKLLENLAYRISDRLFEDFQTIEEIEISIYKENPPMGADCKNVGIRAIFKR